MMLSHLSPSEQMQLDRGTAGFDSTPVVNLRVLEASTGMCHHITLLHHDLCVSNIRSRLAESLTIDDQILLLGPPYKVPRDSLLKSEETITALRLGDHEDVYFGSISRIEDRFPERTQKRRILGPTENTGSKRLFLFSKKALSEGAHDPPAYILSPPPGPLPMPTTSDLPPPPPLLRSENKSTPFRMALEVYERQFMLDMAKGRAYADGADMRLVACRNSISEQAVIVLALRAAVSNLADHRSIAARERAQFHAEYNEIATLHSNLLKKFDTRISLKSVGTVEGLAATSTITGSPSDKVDSLGNMPLHPSLVSAARSAGRVMESLLDVVPLDQERAWAEKCRHAHERLSSSFRELDSAFAASLGTSESWNELVREDLAAEEIVEALLHEIEGEGMSIRKSQVDSLSTLTSNHNEALRIISLVIQHGSDEMGTGGSDPNSAFSALEAISQSASSTIPFMDSQDNVLSDLSQRVADAKTNTMKRMRTRLRQISTSQSSIARANSSVTVLRHALSLQKSDMEHLEHVVELPKCYNDFLLEIRRRRAYCIAFSSNISTLLDRMGSMRADEVKLREKFLRGPGRHLMPAFFEIFAPTLAASPPIFSPPLPDMAEIEDLPDVGQPTEPIGGSSLQTENRDDDRVSSTSTITDCPPSRHLLDSEVSKELNVVSTPNHPSLMVSVDEHSGNDVIMGTVCQDDTGLDKCKAVCATLEYENATLRQALERAGCETPPCYIDTSCTNKIGMGFEKPLERGSLQEKETKLSSLESELASLKLELERALNEADRLKKNQVVDSARKRGQSDKISHTSFQVGDVGLFMPTGRGREGKRIYLAFHSGCPHRYLSPDCITGSPDFVLGRIVYQEQCVAGASDTDSNPFGLIAGTKFWVLTVEIIKGG